LEQGFAETDAEVKQLKQGFAETDAKVEQLEQGFAETDDKVEQLEQGFAETDAEVKQLKQGFAETYDKVEQLEEEVRSQRMKDNKPGRFNLHFVIEKKKQTLLSSDVNGQLMRRRPRKLGAIEG